MGEGGGPKNNHSKKLWSSLLVLFHKLNTSLGDEFFSHFIYNRWENWGPVTWGWV